MSLWNFQHCLFEIWFFAFLRCLLHCAVEWLGRIFNLVKKHQRLLPRIINANIYKNGFLRGIFFYNIGCLSSPGKVCIHYSNVKKSKSDREMYCKESPPASFHHLFLKAESHWDTYYVWHLKLSSRSRDKKGKNWVLSSWQQAKTHESEFSLSELHRQWALHGMRIY